MTDTGADMLRTNLRQWIDLDDEGRRLQARLKEIRQAKTALNDGILTYMRQNQLDDFRLEGQQESVLSRQVRTIKPAIKRNTIHTQILLHLADEPDRARQIIRAIEGIPEGEDAASIIRQREILSRRVPRAPRQEVQLNLEGTE
jgi:hypothetical protein